MLIAAIAAIRSVAGVGLGCGRRAWQTGSRPRSDKGLFCCPPSPFIPTIVSWKKARSVISVRMTPGHTALTRMFAVAYSIAAARVAPITPCLLAP